MGRKTVLFQMLLFQISLLLIALGLTTALYIQSSKRFYYQERQSDLEATTEILRNLIEKQGFPPSAEDAGLYDRTLTENTDSRLTLVRNDGVVVADTHGEVAAMGNHGNRPEIISALKGRQGYSLRYSATLARVMMYVALPVRSGEEIVGVVRASCPGDTIQERISSIYFRVALVSLIVLSLAVLIMASTT